MANLQQLCGELTCLEIESDCRGGETTHDLSPQKTLAKLPDYVKGCLSSHSPTVFESAQRIRCLLASPLDDSVRQVANSGVVARLIQFLELVYRPRLRYEALWILGNLCAAEEPQYATMVKNGGAIPWLVITLSPNLKMASYPLQEQALWTLGLSVSANYELRIGCQVTDWWTM